MSGLQFEGQRDDEKVKLVFRRSILTARRGLLFLLIMVAVGLVIWNLFRGVENMFLVTLGCFVFGIIGAGYVYVMWYFSVYIVTNQRIRQIMQKGIFKKSMIDIEFDKIISSAYHVGMMGKIFNYGTIILNTDGGEIKFSMVSSPEKVYNEMEKEIGKNRL